MPTPIPIPRRSPWMSQILVVNALLKREFLTRFGEYRLGFFWMLFEPLLGVVVIGLLIGSLAGRTVPEIPYPFFLLNGMLIMKLFTGPLNTGINAVGANQGLLVYPSVKPLDTFIARFLYELITTIFSFLLFCAIAMWIGVQLSFASLDVLLACYLITWFTGCGMGLILGVAAAHFNEVEKLVMIVQRPLMFVSAVLLPLSALPESGQQMLLINPLVHTIELARHSLFPFYGVEGPNLAYPTAVAIIVLSVGLTLFHGNRNHLSKV